MVSTRRARRVPALGAFAVLAVPLAVGAVLAVWALARSPLESASAAGPVVAEVGSAQRDHASSTTATLVPAAEVVVRSQSSGTVTALGLRAGRAVHEGDVVLRVDGRPVVAYVADAPLYRDVTASLRGDDATTARRLLVTLGHLREGDRGDDDAVSAAIKAFNARHGRRADGATLRVGSLAWIPSGSRAPQVVNVHVGDSLAPHAALYTTTDGGGSVTVAAPASDAARRLTVGTTTVALPAGATTVTDADDVAKLHAAMGSEDSAPATVADETPTTVGTVPATAVVVAAQGTACYFPGVTGAPVTIDAQEGGLGLVDVDASLVGTPVLVNPRTVRSDLSCAS